MANQKRISKIEYGTLPTPSNPYPSNQVIKKYSHQAVVITPLPTKAVIAEYEQAINAAPEDAGLRVQYGFALKNQAIYLNPVCHNRLRQIPVRTLVQIARAEPVAA